MAEYTVAQKLHQGVPGNSGNNSPAAFGYFFRKKYQEKWLKYFP